jgi:IMP dehydrogenase
MPNPALDAFFTDMGHTALAYPDVRMPTEYSDVTPPEADVRSRFTRNVPLNLPIVSAAMDTVTERPMAIAMAVLGGIGVIHKNMSLERQAKSVRRVKHYLNGKVQTPITVSPDMTLAEVLKMCEEKRYDFRTFPVVDENGQMIGMLSGSDFRFAETLDMKVADGMTPFTDGFLHGQGNTTPEQAIAAMRRAKKSVMPLLEGRSVVGLYLFSDLERIFSGGSPHNVDSDGHLIAAAAVGAGKLAIERAEELVASRCDVLHIDTAHGHSENVLWTIRELKRRFPDTDVAAGNISNPKAVPALIEAGADGILVGQGPGSICTTRIQAGIGCPQVTAVYRCAKAAEGSGVPICADGGIQHPGDIAIAIAIGASSVMLGNRLAGTDASPGEVVTHQGREWKYYRGMGSLAAMRAHEGSRARYGLAGVSTGKLVPEGVEGMVPYKGALAGVIHELVGGLRAGMGYQGAATVAELQAKAELIHITASGQAESRPHHIQPGWGVPID